MGVDGSLIPAEFGVRLQCSLLPNNIQLVCLEENLIDKIWNDRPGLISCFCSSLAIPNTPITLLTPEEAGASVEEKIARVREAVQQNGQNTLILTKLEDVCWLFNMRGCDIQYNPYVYSYAIIRPDFVHLFIHANRLSEEQLATFSDIPLKIHDYDDFLPFVDLLKNDPLSSICFDSSDVSFHVFSKLEDKDPDINFKYCSDDHFILVLLL